MSYSEICDKFDSIAANLKKGTQVVSAIHVFFKGFKKNLDSFNQQLQKLSEGLFADLPKEGNTDTLSGALNELTTYMKLHIQTQVQLSKNVQIDIIEPLELFLEHFTTTNSSLVSRGSIAAKDLAKSTEKVQKTKKSYIESAKLAERSEQMIAEEDTREKQDKALRLALYNRMLANKASENYTKAHEEMNTSWEFFDAEMPEVMEFIQQNEESRIHFLKYTFDKYIRHYKSYFTVIDEALDDFSAVSSKINSSIDVKIFVENLKTEPQKREEMVSYERWKEIQKEKSKQEETQKEPEITTELLIKILNFLTNNDSSPEDWIEVASKDSSKPEDLDPVYFGRISNVFHTPEGRTLFCDSLESLKHKSSLTPTKILQLAAIITSLLTVIMMEEDHDTIVFCKLVVLSHIFYTEDEQGKRVYLSEYISSHNIWHDKERWVEAIECGISAKISADKDNLQKYHSLKKKGNNLFGILKGIKNKFPQKIAENEHIIKSAAVMIISQFSFHMIHLGIPFETANAVILKCCQKVNLDTDRTCVLLAELQANQRMNLQVEDEWKRSLRNREKEREIWNGLLPIGLALDYLNHSESFILLQVCKKWNKKFYVPILKKWLSEAEESAQKIRSKAWIELLRDHMPPIEYQAFVQRITSEPSMISELEEIINMDVLRSYKDSLVNPNSLKNLLKTYAFYNPEVGYCQGMNYIAGTLLIQLQDEEMSFKCFAALIKRFNMTNIFIDDLPKLRQFFYMLDRLTGLLLPEVYEFFMEAGITSAHFSSPWFITLYANILQHKSHILIKLWDLFFQKGWKIIFKAAIAILSRMSRELIGTRYENVMSVLTSISMPNSHSDIFDESFINRLKQIKISNALLKDLEVEYENLKFRAENLKLSEVF